MSSSVIRYRTKVDAADENQRLIEKVFAGLAETRPEGLAYASYRLDDGVTFVHVVTGDGLLDLAAFQEFQKGLADRLDTPVDREPATRVGSY
ncbi:hypothetical protein [Kribbella endophytica]